MNCIQAIYQTIWIVHCSDRVNSAKTYCMTTCWSYLYKQINKTTFTYVTTFFFKKILKADRAKLKRVSMKDRIFCTYMLDVLHIHA